MLPRLNRGPHIVLAATHDIELAELLRGDGYELHHFREEVAGGELVFDYQLHTGPLTTRNAIRILELYDYPTEVIAEAYDTQDRLLDRSKASVREPVFARVRSAVSEACGSPARRQRSAGRKSRK